VLWAGANDYVNNPINQNSDAALDLVGNIYSHIVNLIGQGGTNFLVPNMPALGQLPRFVNTKDEVQFDLLSTQFNEALSAELEELEQDYQEYGITIFRFNVFDLVLQMVNNPSVFGFENVTGTAKSIVGEDPSTFFFGTVVDNPEDYMFFDDVHPTTRTHEILGDFAFNAFVIGSLVEALENDEVEIGGRNSDKTRDGLVKKLTDAEKKIDQGRFSDAIEKLTDFSDKTTALAGTGKLDEDVAQSMVDAADAVIATLSAYVP
jgi:phospholipase/lecithinase/hemolysin